MKYLQWKPNPRPDDEPKESKLGSMIWNGIAFVLEKVIPAANPELSKIHERVVFWWIEANEDGEPVREIGFDERKEAIVLGPIGDNYGMVTDSPLRFEDGKNLKEIEVGFEKLWNRLYSEFSYLEESKTK